METFSQQLGAWQPFFTTLAMLCATLAGLLFVALSLHAASLRGDSRANLRRLAQLSFGDFVQVLFIGTFFIVPLVKPEFFGIVTVMIVAVGMRELVGRFLEAWRDRAHAEHRSYIIRRMGLSLLGRLMLLSGGVGLLLWHDTRPDLLQDLMFVFSGSVVLLIAALRNAWFLLIHELG
jgi:hypothetical protein